MRLVIATIAMMAAGPAAAFGPDFSTRQGCLHTLGQTLRVSQDPHSNRGEQWRLSLETAPDAMSEGADQLIAMQQQIWALELEFSEALMAFCNAYPAE